MLRATRCRPGPIVSAVPAGLGHPHRRAGLFVLVGGAIVMGRETVQTRTAIKDVLPPIVVAGIAVNARLPRAGSAPRRPRGHCALTARNPFLSVGASPSTPGISVGGPDVPACEPRNPDRR